MPWRRVVFDGLDFISSYAIFWALERGIRGDFKDFLVDFRVFLRVFSMPAGRAAERTVGRGVA